MFADGHSSACAAGRPVDALFGLLSQSNLGGTSDDVPGLIVQPQPAAAVRRWPRQPAQPTSQRRASLEAEISGFPVHTTCGAADRTDPAPPPAAAALDAVEVSGWLSEFRLRDSPAAAQTGSSGAEAFDALWPTAPPTPSAAPVREFPEIWETASAGGCWQIEYGAEGDAAEVFSGDYDPEHVTASYIESRGGPAAICPVYSCLVPTASAAPAPADHAFASALAREFSGPSHHRSGDPSGGGGGFRTRPSSSIPPLLNAGLQGIAEAEQILLGMLFGEVQGGRGVDDEWPPSAPPFCGGRAALWDWNRVSKVVARGQDREDAAARANRDQELAHTSRQRLALLWRHMSGESISC